VAASSLERLACIDGLEGLNPAALDTELAERFARGPAALWIQRLTAAGLGAHLSASIEEAMADPWARDHSVIQVVDFPHAGPGLLVGPAPRLSRTPMRAGFPAPPIGWDGEAIVRELGLGERLAELVASCALVLPEAPVPV
jgi:crotonobetainyl-CoA:carnitine CoA-transferase CaiB-like acyl-CoA transferase